MILGELLDLSKPVSSDTKSEVIMSWSGCAWKVLVMAPHLSVLNENWVPKDWQPSHIPLAFSEGCLWGLKLYSAAGAHSA